MTARIHRKYVALPHCPQRIPPCWKGHFLELSLNFVGMIATGHGEDQIGITVHHGLPADLIPGLTGTAQNVNSTREGHHLRHPVATNKRWVEPLQTQDARRISRALCHQTGNLSSKTRDEFGCLRGSIGGLADSENVAPNVCNRAWGEGKHPGFPR